MIVFDSWALLAYFNGESGSAEVEAILMQALESDRQRHISVVNLGEIRYVTFRKHGLELATRLREDIAALGIEPVLVDEDLANLAADFKALGGLSYADAFAAATASMLDAELVTGDPEFLKFKDRIRLRFII